LSYNVHEMIYLHILLYRLDSREGQLLTKTSHLESLIASPMFSKY